MKELKEGKITYKELSVWFGLKPETLSKSSASAKEKKLETLKTFADYHLEGKKIIIDKVKIAEFNKAYNIIAEKVFNEWGCVENVKGEIVEELKKERIDTCTRVAEKIYNTNPDLRAQIKPKTTLNYVNEIKIEGYGHTYYGDMGSKGYSEFVYMEEDGITPLSEEKLQIMKKCAAKAYADVNQSLAAIDEDYVKGLITKEQRAEFIGEVTDDTYRYFNYVNYVMEALNFYPQRKTRLIDAQNWE